MSLPKSLLCLLGDDTQDSCGIEAQLRQAGFATATITWKELEAQKAGLAELAEILQDPAIQGWVVAGKKSDFTAPVISKLSLISLSLSRETLPNTSFVCTDSCEGLESPQSMPHISVTGTDKPFAARLMAARFKPGKTIDADFYIKAHLDPYVGQWLEVGPAEDAVWNGFMAGLSSGAEQKEVLITAFGVGPRGKLPSKSTLEYPIQGIQGTCGSQNFTACAAKNTVTDKESCFVRFEGEPLSVLISDYPGDAEETDICPENFCEMLFQLV